MTEVRAVAQPTYFTTKTIIRELLAAHSYNDIWVAAAYVTSGGVHDLISEVSPVFDFFSGANRKRWLTSFDYFRTEPVALEALASMPASEVRVFGARRCLEARGIPKVPFHPKAYLFRGGTREYLLTGSGNLSRSGLSRGYEAGLAIGIDTSLTAADPFTEQALKCAKDWFCDCWARGEKLTSKLLKEYAATFEQRDNLSHPAATEDDVATEDRSRGALTSRDLQKLRVCRNLWIEAGNITKNRGPHVPGNQLMLKRMSRVFFNFSPSDVAENTLLGSVELRYDKGSWADYNLSYSDNKMDKLGLPIPGSGGPSAYDGQTLLFRQVGPRRFELSIMTVSDRKSAKKESASIEGSFKMASGRAWGVF